MRTNMRTSSDFAEIRAVHSALQFALKGGIYGKHIFNRLQRDHGILAPSN